LDKQTLRYAKTHEWVHVEGETAVIGITDFAVNLLSDLVFVELPGVGSSITQGETFGEIESVKAVSDLYAPLSGEVVEVNTELPNHLDWLNSAPFEQGWMLKVKFSDATQLEELLDAQAYAVHCANESH